MALLKSRTFWTLVTVAVLGAVQALQPFMSPEVFVVVNTMLLALATYFKLVPSQIY